ncbi:alpha-2 macroglobulin-like protein [Elysia marginata]|uniref:Alpha-2 macroglobulin-like protein n=1 Tax=Elysia marginata TaxID=1093978 RepID=A0AAV4GPD8_9GAST|nr:alpha-2 macroglobulin-like protein [Elysia marginata]
MGKALKFLTDRQNKDGSYREDGVVFHKEMQGASAAKGVSLTAYTLIAMHEAQQVFRQGNDSFSMKLLELIEDSMAKAAGYLVSKLNQLTDSFDICVTTYALTLINSTMKDAAFGIMESKAILDGNVKYWERPKPVTEVQENYHWSASTDSINIEMTAYALLVYSLRPNAARNGLPVVKWLTMNKGPNAGFHSTQDTIIGLQALSRVGSELYSGEDIPMNMTVAYRDADGNYMEHVFLLNKANELLLQIARIDYKNMAPRNLNISVQTLSGQQGPSNAVVEVSISEFLFLF